MADIFPCDPPGRCLHGACNSMGDCVCDAGFTGSRCSFLSLLRTLFRVQVQGMVTQKMHMQCHEAPPNSTPLHHRNPVMLIPPMEGSWLESKFTRRMEQPDPVCRRSRSYWKQFWLPDLMLFKGDDAVCWAAGATLGYDENAHGYTYPAGAQYRVNMTVESMCLPVGMDGKSGKSGRRATFCAYECICKRLEALGYKQNKDLHAVPFDWRLGPQNWLKVSAQDTPKSANDDVEATGAGGDSTAGAPQWGYFEQLKTAIERAHDRATAAPGAAADKGIFEGREGTGVNERGVPTTSTIAIRRGEEGTGGRTTTATRQPHGRPVMLVGFSLSCPMLRYFLAEYVTPEWKHKYVAGFVSFSGVFSGSLTTLPNLLSTKGQEFHLGVPAAVQDNFRRMFQSWGMSVHACVCVCVCVCVFSGRLL